jgi:hypothetical protein
MPACASVHLPALVSSLRLPVHLPALVSSLRSRIDMRVPVHLPALVSSLRSRIDMRVPVHLPALVSSLRSRIDMRGVAHTSPPLHRYGISFPDKKMMKEWEEIQKEVNEHTAHLSLQELVPITLA